MLRLKVICTKKSGVADGETTTASAEFIITPVASDDSANFRTWTPQVALNFSSLVKVANKIEEGKEYYLDLIPADK